MRNGEYGSRFRRGRASVRALGVIVVAFSWGGCARTVPRASAQAALYRDLQRMVSLSSAAGWEIDRVEVEELVPDALMSVC